MLTFRGCPEEKLKLNWIDYEIIANTCQCKATSNFTNSIKMLEVQTFAKLQYVEFGYSNYMNCDSYGK